MEVDRDRLKQHVAELARSPRPAGSDRLEECRQYVTQHLEAAGWTANRYPFRTTDDYGTNLAGINLIAQHRDYPWGDRPRFCVGAHLDSLPHSPGADDNASAVATLLEIARLLPGTWPAESPLDLELLVFDLEERGMLGGAAHVEWTRENRVDLRGMVSLEMLGYCDHRPQSQQLPRSLIGMYPETGNFIAIIGNQNSERLIGLFRTGMQRVAELPVEWLAVPANGEFLQATRLSDHSPFWDAGYPALMITDTSFLRNPYYHTPEDTPETLDLKFLHRVAQSCLEAVRHIVGTGL